MEFSNNYIGGGADGGIFELHCEFPMWMEHADVSQARAELNLSVQAIQEPPIAQVSLSGGADAPIEDYRRFYVEFAPEATIEHIADALAIVAGALQKYRYA